ncbi:MAG: hypothetical protein JWP08_2760 [Bryobacterales bacterium]|nr:hypothetical protein [Bryobacterales bacterium]
MRARGSIGGPLILIALGVLFLIHTFAPEFRIAELLTNDWPYFLILWGVIQLAEIFLRAVRGAPIAPNGISGGSWFLVLLICFAGLGNWEARRQDTWWRRVGLEHGMEMFGQAHDYSISPIQKTAGKAPRVVIESFRGSAKLVGSDGDTITVNGRKAVRALESGEADRANSQTPVEVLLQGNTVVIRCNQDRAGGHNQITTELDLTLPRGASVEATGRGGDFDVTGLTGDVDLTSENGEMHIQDVGGNVKVETNRSDLVRCTNVKGTVTVRGRGSDVDLSKIAGAVSVHGDYNGTVSLHQIAKAVRVESMRTELGMQRVPGEVTVARGSLEARDVVGPSKISTHSTDVTLNGFSDSLDLAVDKGDVELRPGRLPLSKISVRSRSGNIELALPEKAGFALSASTEHGEIENEFGGALSQRAQGSGAKLDGSIGSGPELSVTTDRGTITVRKSTADEDATKTSEPDGKPEKGQEI